MSDAARELPAVWTVGHSTRSLDDFLSLLRAYGISRVIDVRTIPRSATNPQFNRATLPRALRRAGIGYLHLPGLGARGPARRIPAGGTARSGATPTTCRRPSSRRTCNSSKTRLAPTPLP